MTGLPQTFHNVVAFIWFFLVLRFHLKCLSLRKYNKDCSLTNNFSVGKLGCWKQIRSVSWVCNFTRPKASPRTPPHTHTL